MINKIFDYPSSLQWHLKCAILFVCAVRSDKATSINEYCKFVFGWSSAQDHARKAFRNVSQMESGYPLSFSTPLNAFGVSP